MEVNQYVDAFTVNADVCAKWQQQGANMALLHLQNVSSNTDLWDAIAIPNGHCQRKEVLPEASGVWPSGGTPNYESHR